MAAYAVSAGKMRQLDLAELPRDLAEFAQFGAGHTAFLAPPRRQLGGVPAPHRPRHAGAGDLLRTSGWERLEAGGAPPLRHGFFPRPGAVALLPRSEQVTTSPSGKARGPGRSACPREGSLASPGRSAGCSPLEGAPRRSPPPGWAPSGSWTWRPPGLGVSWETSSLDLSHVTISQKQLDSSIHSVVCREFAEPLSPGCGLRPVANPGGGGGGWGLHWGFWRLPAAALCSPCPRPGKGLLCPPRGACSGPRSCKGYAPCPGQILNSLPPGGKKFSAS